ncbi:MAG TPA: MEDS domain-containing protein [Gemmatimonadaceae bacterium]|nr:MEDS domain-containing protein [Gemmatimonadaceae bacterium]
MQETHIHLAKALAETSCELGCTPPGITGHDVQFYKTDDYLIESVVGFLGDGIRAGQPIIVIATEPHRRALVETLRSRGLDPDKLYSGQLSVWLDARETLNAFMEGSKPSRELFYATVGSVFERLLEKRYYLVVRAYGEMVDLLYKDGNSEGALAVEDLWNELANHYKYSLLCGYCVDNFLHEAGVEGFRRVCDHHRGALPIESVVKHVA